MTKTTSDKPKYTCSDCEQELDENAIICPNCGANVEEIEEEEDIAVPYHFRALLTYGSVISFVGWLEVIIGLILIINYIVSKDSTLQFVLLPIGVYLTLFGFLAIAIGQVFACFVTIEKNTRETNNILITKLDKLIAKLT